MLVLASPAAAEAKSLGNTAAGSRLFEARCRRCHSLDALAGKGDRVLADLRRVDARMAVVGLLWTQEVADLRAFLNALPPPAAE